MPRRQIAGAPAPQLQATAEGRPHLPGPSACWRRAAADSIARGRPSSPAQTAATSAAFSAVNAEVGLRVLRAHHKQCDGRAYAPRRPNRRRGRGSGGQGQGRHREAPLAPHIEERLAAGHQAPSARD